MVSTMGEEVGGDTELQLGESTHKLGEGQQYRVTLFTEKS